MTTTRELMLTPKEAAAILAVSERQVYRLIRAGRLHAVDLSVGGAGKRPLYRISASGLDLLTA